MKTVLRVESVERRYGSVEALRGVSLTVGEGEVVVVIGPSGSGKSTLLRLVALLEPLDGGAIYVDDVLVAGGDGGTSRHRGRHLRHLRGEIGMVFQQFNLWPHMTALGNVALAPTLVRGLSKSEAKEAARQALISVGLGDRGDEYPSKLSGGQQQRVAIARALAMNPKILLFDEVTSALDPELIVEVLAVMRQLAESGRTMLVVTHEMSFAREAAHRVIFIDSGLVVEEGPAHQVLENPEHARTRAFLGKFVSAPSPSRS